MSFETGFRRTALCALLGIAGVSVGCYLAFVVGRRPGEGHLIFEVASGLVAIGVLSLCYACRLAKSLPWRVSGMVLFALLAIVHWMEYLSGSLPLASPLLNSLPILMLLIAEVVIFRRLHRRPTHAKKQ